ncbi:MAG: GNAT family N-acetyltransferase [Alphaproteobacteria bacterium]
MTWRALGGRVALRRTVLFRHEAAVDGRPEGIDGFRFGALGLEHFVRSGLVAGRGRSERYAARLEAGHRCWGHVGADGEIASFLWVTPAGSGITVPIGFGLTLRPPPGAAYVWDCRTARAVRGRGLYRAGLRAVARLSRDGGATSVWIDCDPDNVPSIRAIRRAGFAPSGGWSLLRLGPVVACLAGRASALLRHSAEVTLDPVSGAPRSSREQTP